MLQTILIPLIFILISIWFKVYDFPIEYNLIMIILMLFLYYEDKQFNKFCKVYQKQIGRTINAHDDYIILSRRQEIAKFITPELFDRYLSVRYPFCSESIENSPFLRACQTGDSKLVEHLLQQGANILEKNVSGEGAIYLATYYSVKNPTKHNVKCLWMLYHAGCPINDRNNQGFTPLQLAAFHGHTGLCKWLLLKGADPKVEPSPIKLALLNDYLITASEILSMMTMYKNV